MEVLPKVASDDKWEKVELKVFGKYPKGVRYIKFKDGGKDVKWWAGHFGVKMVGAYVGFHPLAEE